MLRYGCAAPLMPRQQTLDHQIVQRPPYRTLTHPKLFGELHLAGQKLPRAPVVRRQSREQRLLDFLV